jgi:hypothetical protein
LAAKGAIGDNWCAAVVMPAPRRVPAAGPLIASKEIGRKTFSVITVNAFGGISKLAHRKRVLLGIVLNFSWR